VALAVKAGTVKMVERVALEVQWVFPFLPPPGAVGVDLVDGAERVAKAAAVGAVTRSALRSPEWLRQPRAK
jgi:hypothetical protein